MTWFDDGVRWHVDISSNLDAINPQNPIDIPIRPGGPNGAPLGWTFDEVFPTAPIGTNSYRGRVMNNMAYVEYIGTIPLANNDPPAAGGIYLSYIWTGPIIAGHRYMISSEIGGSTDRHSGTGMQLQVLPQPSGTFYDNIEFNSGFPDVTFQTVVTAPASGMPAGATGLKIRFLVRSAHKIGGGGSNQQPWTGIVRRVQVTDLDASSGATPLTPTFYPVECDSQRLQVRYGRSRFTERYDVGVFNVQLNNVQGDYSYNPNHPQNFSPGRLLRVRASINGGPLLPVCFGIIRTIVHRMEPDQTATVILGVQDPTSLLSEVTVPSLRITSGFFDSGWRIASLLDYAGIPENWQDIEPGQWRTQHIRQSGRSVREEVGVTADSEGGSFYASREGHFIYDNRVSVANDPKALTVQAEVQAYPGYPDVIVAPVSPDGFPTVDDAPVVCPHDIDTEWTTDRVINRVALATVDGNRVTYDLLASQRQYGIKTYQRLDYVLEGTTAQREQYLSERATDFFNASGTADLRVIRMSFRPNRDTYQFALDVFLNWAVRVWYFNTAGNWGFSSVSLVQAIEHSITPVDWVMHVTLDQSAGWSQLVALDPGGWDLVDWDAAVWDDEAPAGAIWSAGFRWSNPESKWGE